MAVVAGSHKKRRSRCGEAAGDATALMCCCPCTVIKLLVLTLYKLPGKMCCRCLSGNKKKPNRQTNDLLVRRPRDTTAEGGGGASSGGDEAAATAAVVVDREMLERFSGKGFWRSGSQKDFDG